MRVLTGEYFNLIRLAYALTEPSGGAVDADFPIDNIRDTVASEPLMLSEAETPLILHVDLNLLIGADGDAGGFETAEQLDDWTQSTPTGATVSITSNPRSGSAGTKALALTMGATAGVASASETLSLPSGKKFRFAGWYAHTAASGNPTMTVQNLATGSYLHEDGTWGDPGVSYNLAQSYSGVRASAGDYVAFSIEFSLESFEEAGHRDQVPVRVLLGNGTVSSVARFDDLSFCPGVDATSIHGFNFPASAAISVRSSEAAAFGVSTVRFELTGDPPACGGVLDAVVFARYWRLYVEDTVDPPLEPWFLGEWVLGQTYLLREQPRHPGVSNWVAAETMPQITNATELGEEVRINLSDFAQRNKVYPFRDIATRTLEGDLQQELFERTRYGALPFVLFPDDNADDALLVKIAGKWSADSLAEATDGWDRVLELWETPFPTVT